MTKTKIDHARILNAYLARMTLADLENVMQASKCWTYVAMNYSNSRQNDLLQAKAGFYAAVCNSVNNLMAHDINYVELVIDEETA